MNLNRVGFLRQTDDRKLEFYGGHPGNVSPEDGWRAVYLVNEAEIGDSIIVTRVPGEQFPIDPEFRVEPTLGKETVFRATAVASVYQNDSPELVARWVLRCAANAGLPLNED